MLASNVPFMDKLERITRISNYERRKSVDCRSYTERNNVKFQKVDAESLAELLEAPKETSKRKILNETGFKVHSVNA